jgi:release factor glutamine methyltransferase
LSTTLPLPLGEAGAQRRVRGTRADVFPRRLWRALLRIKLALLDRGKYERIVLENFGGMSLVVLPDVFNPKLLRSGEFLVRQLSRPDLLPAGARVLDLGCGSGAAGIGAALRGSSVVAVDINPSAVRCTRINALLNQIDPFDVRLGDLFAPVSDLQFDVVLFNPPYYRGVPRDALDYAWRSPDIAERFASCLGAHLTPRGHALVVLSSDGDSVAFLDVLQRNGFACSAVATRDFINEVMTVYRVSPL